MTEQVAVIGAGPAGLAAARWLKQRGLTPVLIEAHDGIGGQWDGSNPLSGVWPEMRTNTARITTSFSDLDYPADVAVFPRNQEVLAYLRRYAQMFGLLDGARLGSRLQALDQVQGGYRLRLESRDGIEEITVPRVVIASGRYNKPNIPAIPGLAGFTGELGARHAFHYKSPEAFRGKRVVVAGGSISALEIASDLAMLGSRAVVLSQRRQRYVMPKMVRGVPLEYYAFTRGGALMRDHATAEELDRAQQDFVLAYGGDPARYGAPKPHPDIRKAGFTGSQHYLNLVAENRLAVRPWIARVQGQTVTFTDGSAVEADAIIIGTGFDLNLPFLSPEIARTLQVDAKGLCIADFTFHPDLPGLALMGLWPQQGPYPVPLEQQARYIAYAWSGAIPAPSRARLEAGLAACTAEAQFGDYRDQNEMALRFARLCGTDPAGVGDAALQRMLAASATTAIMFRMTGPDALPDAVERFRAQFHRFGPALDAAAETALAS